MLEEIVGYNVSYYRHAKAILKHELSQAHDELVETLKQFTFTEIEIIQGGGGESEVTQRLRGLFNKLEWKKKKFTVNQLLDNTKSISESHEIDHYKNFDKGNIGLEIEWNNKDPFFDRDLENFRKLHQLGAISIGVIITRGALLQKELLKIHNQFFTQLNPKDIYDLKEITHGGKIIRETTTKQREAIKKKVKNGDSLVEATAKVLYSNKFGTSTTHWDKLIERIDRGLGNPCPLVLIGINTERLEGIK